MDRGVPAGEAGHGQAPGALSRGLAEGQNLQQCARIINYYLPWNPMRLVQRHGRIDRIGSPHADVFITCIFPDRQLDALLTIAATHVRANRPPEMTLEDQDRLVDIIEAPHPLRFAHAPRDVFAPHTTDGVQTTRAIATKVREFGLRPWKAPEPLPPIGGDEITLVVRMAVAPADGRRADTRPLLRERPLRMMFAS